MQAAITPIPARLPECRPPQGYAMAGWEHIVSDGSMCRSTSWRDGISAAEEREAPQARELLPGLGAAVPGPSPLIAD